MAAFSGQLTVFMMDPIVVSTATGIPHTVGEKGTLLRGTQSDLGVAAAAAVQALVADCLSTSKMFHFEPPDNIAPIDWKGTDGFP